MFSEEGVVEEAAGTEASENGEVIVDFLGEGEIISFGWNAYPRIGLLGLERMAGRELVIVGETIWPDGWIKVVVFGLNTGW